MATFVRSPAKTGTEHGTRPGLHDQTLISSGLADFDKVLGGGVPLGTIVLLCEDPCSRQHLNLLRYYLAEGAACGQSICWVGHENPSEGFRSFLPRCVEPSTSAVEERDDESSDENLRIAWQYKRYIREKQATHHSPSPATTKSKSAFRKGGSKSQAAAGVALNWSHTFDLSKSMEETTLAASPVKDFHRTGNCAEVVSKVTDFIAKLEDKNKPGTRGRYVGRAVVQSLCCDLKSLGFSQDLLLSLFRLKQAVRGTSCTVFISLQAPLFEASTVARAFHIVDGVIGLEALTSDSDVCSYMADPSSGSCLLHIRKTPGAGEQERQVYVIRRRRKRLAIDVVVVDPDAEAEQDAASGQWQKAATDALLSANPASVLDF